MINPLNSLMNTGLGDKMDEKAIQSPIVESLFEWPCPSLAANNYSKTNYSPRMGWLAKGAAGGSAALHRQN